MTKMGQGLVNKPIDPFEIVVPFFLFNLNHAHCARSADDTIRDWETAMNSRNVKAETGLSLGEFCSWIFGHEQRNRKQHWKAEGDLYVGVLRPLCWAAG